MDIENCSSNNKYHGKMPSLNDDENDEDENEENNVVDSNENGAEMNGDGNEKAPKNIPRIFTEEEVEILKSISVYSVDGEWMLPSTNEGSFYGVLRWPDGTKITRKGINRLKKLNPSDLVTRMELHCKRVSKVEAQLLRARLEMIHMEKAKDELLGGPDTLKKHKTLKKSKKRKTLSSEEGNDKENGGNEEEQKIPKKKRKVEVKVEETILTENSGMNDGKIDDVEKKEEKVVKKKKNESKNSADVKEVEMSKKQIEPTTTKNKKMTSSKKSIKDSTGETPIKVKKEQINNVKTETHTKEKNTNEKKNLNGLQTGGGALSVHSKTYSGNTVVALDSFDDDDDCSKITKQKREIGRKTTVQCALDNLDDELNDESSDGEIDD